VVPRYAAGMTTGPTSLRGVALMLAAGFTLSLSACGRGDDAGPQEVSRDEARALDEAAQMLESRRPPADLLQSAPAGELPPGPPGADSSAPAVPTGPLTPAPTPAHAPVPSPLATSAP